MNKEIYKKLIEENKYLYHITEYENLKSIINLGGLLSLDNLEKRNIIVKYISSSESRSIDKKQEISKYVRLAYTVQYDMICACIYRKYLKNPVIIFIKPEILLEKENIKYTTMNAISNEAILYDKNDEFEIEFDKIYTPRSYSNANNISYKNARQSEVLVEDCVELKYIKVIALETNTIEEIEVENIKIAKGDVKDIITRIER